MAKIFEQIRINKPRRNAFNLSHERKMSMNMGDLVPCMVQEVIPGDRFRVSMEHLIRLQALNSPMMHRVDVYTHFYFVPNRIIWNEFEDFITGGEDGTKQPVFPTISFNQSSPSVKKLMGIGSLADYLGFPSYQITTLGNGSFPKISALPFRAYQLIWNEYYRDQNLQTKIDVNKNSGNLDLTGQILSDYNLQKRAWEKDYFTSALPFAQRGEQLHLPITGNAPVVTGTGPALRVGNPIGTTVGEYGINTQNANQQGDTIHADMSNVTSSTITELRTATNIQRWLEKSARGGARYVENILTQFGVKSSDARLQRPEYLGGGKTPVVISEVLQQSATQSNSPQGNMAGHGISVGKSNRFKKSFEEHGYVIGIMSVMPRTAYMQGLPRHWTKFDKFDYFWPDLAHLGEQEVRSEELYFNPNGTITNKETFGYQPRYAEYRFNNDTVHGDFTDTLDFWHMARKFDTKPNLNSSFVKCDATDRVFAVSQEIQDQLLVQTYVNFQAIRALPKFGTPGYL